MFLFGKKNKEDECDKACMLCLHSKLQNDGYVCKYKGEVDKFSSCRRYSYDITKKKPQGIDPSKILEISEELGDLLK